jgi:hypothetical protein
MVITGTKLSSLTMIRNPAVGIGVEEQIPYRTDLLRFQFSLLQTDGISSGKRKFNKNATLNDFILSEENVPSCPSRTIN